MVSSASGQFGPLILWAIKLLSHHINLGDFQHCQKLAYIGQLVVFLLASVIASTSI